MEGKEEKECLGDPIYLVNLMQVGYYGTSWTDINNIDIQEAMNATEYRNKYEPSLSIPVVTSGINYNDSTGLGTTASGMCHIIVDRAVGFSDEIDLDQYNTLPDDEAATLLAKRLDGNQAIIFTTGDTGSIDDHDAWKGMTRIWTDRGQGGYWVNNDTITCEG